MKTEKKEVNAVVLDILQKGYANDPRPVYKREPLIQAVGIDQFKLLELVPKSPTIGIHEKVYIGDEEREKIERVKRRLGYEELTPTARLELPYAVEKIVHENEGRFVQFFNKAISITPRLHMLHLLPGIGKKLMWEILAEREKKPFQSFEDIRQRIKTITKPEKMIINRILQEIEDPETKYRVFTTK
jgi:putative nucleotide binding protein